MADIDTIIENAIATAQTQTEAADNAAQQAIMASGGYSYINPTQIAFTPTAVEPAVPNVDNSQQTYESRMAELVALLSAQLADYFQKYYPLSSDAFDSATNWLIDSITNGGTGINPAIEAQIYQRGRDRVINEGIRVATQISEDMASRGFSLPQGSMVGKLQELRISQLGAIGNLVRDVSIEQFKMEVENVRFAVGKALESRIAAMNAAADYIRSLMAAPDAAARVALINSDAKAKALSATAELYRARLSRDQLILNARIANVENITRVGATNVDGFYKGIDARVNAAGHAASVYGSAAGAALSSLNSLVSSAEVQNL